MTEAWIPRKFPSRRESFEDEPEVLEPVCPNALCYLNGKGICEASKNMDLMASPTAFRDMCRARRESDTHYKGVEANTRALADLRANLDATRALLKGNQR